MNIDAHGTLERWRKMARRMGFNCTGIICEARSVARFGCLFTVYEVATATLRGEYVELIPGE